MVETFRTTIAANPLVGSYSAFNNSGGIIHPLATIQEMEELGSLLEIPICTGTVNKGSSHIGAGLVVND